MSSLTSLTTARVWCHIIETLGCDIMHYLIYNTLHCLSVTVQEIIESPKENTKVTKVFQLYENSGVLKVESNWKSEAFSNVIGDLTFVQSRPNFCIVWHHTLVVWGETIQPNSVF